MSEATKEKSLLIGKRVRYSVTKQETSEGIVLDKVDKKEKEGDQVTVTGYMIEDDNSGDIVNVSYWRIQKVIREDLDSPKYNLKGGYKRG